MFSWFPTGCVGAVLNTRTEMRRPSISPPLPATPALPPIAQHVCADDKAVDDEVVRYAVFKLNSSLLDPSITKCEGGGVR